MKNDIESLEREWMIRTVMEEITPWSWKLRIVQKLKRACKARDRDTSNRYAKILEETLKDGESVTGPIRVRITHELRICVIMVKNRQPGAARRLPMLPESILHIADYVCEVGPDGTIELSKDRIGDFDLIRSRIMNNIQKGELTNFACI